MAAAAGANSHGLTVPYRFGVPWPELNDGLAYTDVVKPSETASTLIEFYSTKYAHSAPPQGWIQRIQNGQIAVDGDVVTDPHFKIRIGSTILYHRLPWREPDVQYWLEVLYDDGDMVAINKPSGLQVLPGGLFQQRTVLTQLQWLARGHSTICPSFTECKNFGPSPVHRLGRGTSGILLCAKTKIAKTCLASYFADGASAVLCKQNSDAECGCPRRIMKLYRALVTGTLVNDEVIIRHPIGVIHYPGVATGLYVISSSGKPALSIVKVLERDLQKDQSLVEVEIRSGRPHQIRIHLAFIGHPLVGDPLYAIGGLPKCIQPQSFEGFAEDGGHHRPTTAIPGDCGYYLHAHRLVLCHPSKNEMIDITAPLPPILQTRQELHGIGSTSLREPMSWEALAREGVGDPTTAASSAMHGIKMESR